MSNPFAAFRKNQKTWMAMLVLVAIFAFVIAPVFDYFNKSSGGAISDNTVAVRWQGGQLTRGDLINRIEKHSSLVRFMSEVANRVLEQGGVPAVPGFRHDPTTGRFLGLGIQVSSTPQDIVRTQMLADHGRTLGVEFDDNAVDQFMQAYVNNKLSTDEVSTILREASNGKLSYFEVREMLKDELSVKVVQQMGMAGLFAENNNQFNPIVSPGKTFADYKKINQSAKVEAFPVFAEEYVSKVSDSPTEDEIEAIYTLGAQQAPNPSSPEPGFMRRYAANVEYVEANMEDWIAREKEKLTEEEIRTEYDRRVELGQLQVPVTEENVTEENASEESASGDAEEPSQSNEDAQSDATESEESDASEATEPESDSLELSESEPATTEEPKDETDSPDSSDQSSWNDKRERIVAKPHFTALIAQDEPSASPPPVVQPPQLENSSGTTDSTETGTNSGTEKPAAETSGDAQASETPASPSETPASPSETPGSTEAAEPEMRTQTFEEAKDAIADSLAREKASPALEAAMTKLIDEHMKPYYAKHRQYRAFLQSGLEDSGEQREAPVKPDIKKIATDLGLKWAETGLVDGVALAQTPFGLGNIRPDETGISGSVANVVMSTAVEPFRPLRSYYFDQAALSRGEVPEFLQYVLWKTEDRPAYIPDLDEVREEVVDTWKLLKARQLAENAAQEIAKKVSGGEDPWSGALSATERSLVIETDPFSWMNRMGEFMTISPVNKLEPTGGVGGEFMREVFSTPVNEFSVAPSANRNIYYVFRVLEVSPSEEDLQQNFQADPMKQGPKRLALDESQRLFVGWIENLEQEMGLEWQMNIGQLN